MTNVEEVHLLPVIWAFIIAFGLLMYVLLDGFDLGVGTLFGLSGNEEHRRIMMNTLAPTWDGNETWIVLAGGGLLAAFPMAYAVVLPALYLPLIFMLIGLIFRGVAFEFRYKSSWSRPLWDLGFYGGSTVAAFCQGIVLGAFIQGFPVEDGQYAGEMLGWLNPLNLLAGVGVVVGYVLLGCTWLIMRTTGDMQEWAYRIAPGAVLATFLALVAMLVGSFVTESGIAHRWADTPSLMLIPAAGFLAMVALTKAIMDRREQRCFWLAILSFLLAFGGLAASLWPMVIPHNVTIWEAASSESSQAFMLHGIAFVLPIILIYTGFSYWVFRGKVTKDMGYH